MADSFKTFNLLVSQQSLITRFEENLKETLNLMNGGESLKSNRIKNSEESTVQGNSKSSSEMKSEKINKEESNEEILKKTLLLNQDLKQRIYEITEEKSQINKENEKLKKKVNLFVNQILKKDIEIEKMQLRVKEIETAFERIEEGYKSKNLK